MTTGHLQQADPATRRAAIERIIASYPAVGEAEVQDVLHYFKREASALDRGTIASNSDIERQYRQLCDDHYIDRLKPWETAGTVALAMILLGGVAMLSIVF